MAEIVGTLVRKWSSIGDLARLGIDLDADLGQAEPLGVGAAADGDQDAVALERQRLAVLRLGADGHAVPLDLRRR